MNLHLDYYLFNMPVKFKQQFCKFIEHYLAEYCSESLSQLSLQNATPILIFEDTKKRFNNVKTLHIEFCRFEMNLTFINVFPNVQTLKLGHNEYKNTSAIRVHFPMLKNVYFFDQVLHIYLKEFQEEDIEGFLKLNPQLEMALLHLYTEYTPRFFSRIKEYGPNIQIIGRNNKRTIWPRIFSNPFSVLFFWERVFPSQYRYLNEISPGDTSDDYKLALENLFDLYVYEFSHTKI